MGNTLTNDLIDKIEGFIGNISSPSDYSFLYESYENANVLIDGMTYTKLAVLVNIVSGKLFINGNSITEEPPITIVFAMNSELNSYYTTKKAIYDSLFDDVITFIRLLNLDNDLKPVVEFDFELFDNFLDANLAAIALTFKTKLLTGVSVNSCP